MRKTTEDILVLDILLNSFIFVLVFFCSTREFFTHMMMTPLPVKGCKFRPMFGTHGQWAVMFFNVPHLLWHWSTLYKIHFPGCLDTRNCCWAFSSKTFTICFFFLQIRLIPTGDRSPISRMRGEHSTSTPPLRHRGGSFWIEIAYSIHIAI